MPEPNIVMTSVSLRHYNRLRDRHAHLIGALLYVATCDSTHTPKQVARIILDAINDEIPYLEDE